MPARPGRVDFADAFDGAVVVVAFGGEVLPHEKVCCAVVDCVAEVGEGLEGDNIKGGGGCCSRGGRRRMGRWCGWGKPIMCIGEDEAHHVGATMRISRQKKLQLIRVIAS